MDSGIYKIVHSPSGRVYIGQAQNIKGRLARHLRNLRGGKHHSEHLQSAWAKYGEREFEFCVVEYCPLDDLDEREQFWIDNSNSEFNKCKFVKSFWRGQRHKHETKLKIGQKQVGNSHAKGNKLSQETKDRMRKAHLGRKHSDETKAKIGRSNKGKSHSAETRLKLSKAQAGNKYRLGQSPSAETKAKLSAANKRWWAEKKEANK